VDASPGVPAGLLVRAQNCSFTPGTCVSCNVDRRFPLAPLSPGAFPGSVVTFSKRLADGTFAQPYMVFAPLAGSQPDESFGTEDPRLTLDRRTGLYHLF